MVALKTADINAFLAGPNPAQPVVQQRVGVRGREQIAGVEQPAHLGEDGAQVVHVLSGGMCGGLANGQPLERGARLQDLDRLGQRNAAHAGAAMGLELHQALVLEPGQRGAHGRAPHAEPPRQIGLHQALVGQQPTGHDRGSQTVLGAVLSGAFHRRKIVDNFVHESSINGSRPVG